MTTRRAVPLGASSGSTTTVTDDRRRPDAAPRVQLEARGLITGFGSNQVLHGIDLAVHEGQVVGIFGLNGAGKSVTIKCLAGLLPLWAGSVWLDGNDITTLSPEQRVARGIGNVPQGRHVFSDLTIEENLRLGAYTSRRTDRASYDDRLAAVFDQFPVLAEKRHELAGTLSGGQQASLAVGRALINRPRILLIDEPSAGLAPIIVEQLREILQQVADGGVTMVMVEQNVTFGLKLVDRAAILQTGRVVYDGGVAELDHDTLAQHLGIGRMLGRSTGTALTTRRADEPAAAVESSNGAVAPAGERTGRAATPTRARKRSAARKRPPASTQAAATKKTATKKAAAKKKPAKKKPASTKRPAAKKTAARKKPAAKKKASATTRSTRRQGDTR